MGYRDLDVQHVIAELEDPDGSHADQLEIFENAQRFDPLGGLAREEVAELVAVYTTVHAVYLGTNDDPAGAEAFVELSFDSEEQLINILQDDVTETDVIDGVDAHNVDIVDIDILGHWSTQMYSPVQDETNGVGLGGTFAPIQDWLHLRSWFGEGPVLDRHDEMHVHLGWNEQGDATSGFTIRAYHRLYWDVFER